MAQWRITTCRVLVFAVAWLGWIHVPSLFAAETFYISSDTEYLNMWSGPGMEYRVVSRLPHGTKVTVHEYWGQWAKISSATNVETQGWVLKQNLTAGLATTWQTFTPLDREQEERRFSRLRRKGVLGVQAMGAGGVLRLTMSPLIWRRLPTRLQEHFLRRAQQYFGGSVVEMLDRRNQTLMARLTSSGGLELILPPGHAAQVPHERGFIAPQRTPSTLRR